MVENTELKRSHLLVIQISWFPENVYLWDLKSRAFNSLKSVIRPLPGSESRSVNSTIQDYLGLVKSNWWSTIDAAF